MLNKLVFPALLCFCFAQLAPAQGYFQPGVSYVYRSINPAGGTSVLTIVFDTDGNAAIARNQVASTANDRQLFQVLAPLDEISSSTNSADGSGEVGISGSLSNYWVISFDNPTTDARPTNSITIDCNCKLGAEGAKCSVSYVQQGNSLNATCVQEAGCQTCEMKTTVNKDKRIVGCSLLLKANSVVLQ